MSGEIQQALIRLNERKIAMGASGEVKQYRDREHLALVSGLDLDPEELIRAERLAAGHGLSLALEGAPSNAILAEAFRDGLVAGMLIAEARAKAEARA